MKGTIVTNPSRSNAGNARRQKSYRSRKRDAGLTAVTVWLSFETLQNLRALAFRRRMTLDTAAALAIYGEWEAAGRP